MTGKTTVIDAVLKESAHDEHEGTLFSQATPKIVPFQKKDEKEENKAPSPERQNWLYYTRNPLMDTYRDNLYKELYALIITLSLKGDSDEKRLGVSLRLVDTTLSYDIRVDNLENFLFAVIVGEQQVVSGNEITVELEEMTREDAGVIRFLDGVFREGAQVYERGVLWLQNTFVRDFLSLIREHERVVIERKPAFFSDAFFETAIKGTLTDEKALSLSLTLSSSDATAEIDTSKAVTFGRECDYVLVKNVFYRTIPSYPKAKMDYFPSSCVIPHAYIKDFYARVYETLRKDFRLDLPEGLFNEDIKVFPVNPIIFLDYDGEEVFATIKFKYGKYTVDPYTGDIASSVPEIVTNLYRDSEKESFLCETLGRYLTRLGEYTFSTRDDEKMFYLSYKAIPILQDKGWTFFYSESFRSLRLNVKPGNVSVKLTRDINFFEVNFSIDGVDDLHDMSELIKQARAGKEYIRLQSGSFMPVDLGVMNYIARLFKEAPIEKNDENAYLLPLFNAPYFVEELEKREGIELEMGELGRDTLRQIRQVDYEDTPPDNLNGTFRPYQEVGYRWMRKLANMGLSGILADDMGLGKSFQTIACILKEKELGNPNPTLVVCPTSCVVNWYMEIQKFANTLKAVVIQGTTQQREKMIRTLTQYDVGITSYSALRRDVKRYVSVPLNYIILDEAQHIKNPNTQNAKAAKALASEKRLVLTGTPMENSISELWSLFDFLMPGFFPKHKDFVDIYEVPILSERDDTALENLRRKIAPFILRRLKKNVLKDLPPKHTNVTYCDLTKDQKELYLSILDAARFEIFETVKKKGFESAKIEIFSALTRLRQVCCHPKLLDISLRGTSHSSGKFNLFMEMMDEIIDGGHNVLVFSQFTGMLKHIAAALKEKRIDFLYLDGATKNRMDLVNRFNAGEAPIFLLSLKAAGTGLTLTKADTVIHFDLWWNPAVEDQATDRAYRIGQKREVTTYKLVTTGTIEEKILALQEKKRELIEEIIEGGKPISKAITWEEVQSLLQ